MAASTAMAVTADPLKAGASISSTSYPADDITVLTDSVSNTTVLGAIASGGNGGTGANGGDGGLAQGGGIAADVQSPTGTLDVTISGSILLGNDASAVAAGRWCGRRWRRRR